MVSQQDVETKATSLPYPKAVGFIVVNEFCERFSYYGMRTILSLYLRDKLGFSDDSATIIYHTFTMFAYFFPLIGAMIADAWLGRFRTILYLSIVYSLGSILISVTAMPPVNLPPLAFTIISLCLIAFGTGGIKPCVSAFGGDQFKLPEQERYLSYFFSLFYFMINAGSLISTFLTPILRADVHCFGDTDCYSLAFGVPGLLMIISLIILLVGKPLYKIRKPTGNVLVEVFKCMGTAISSSFKSKDKKDHWLDHAAHKYDTRLIDDIKAMLRVLVLFIPLPVFWALFDQQGSRWTFQADRMEQSIGSWTLKADQMQVLNPLLILIMIPLFEVAIYPAMTWCRLIRKPLHKMIWGGLLAALAFCISAIVELNLLPTYGTPVTEGFAQLRVYNTYNCNFTIDGPFASNATVIPPLSMYRQLEIPAMGHIELAYSMQGQGPCQSQAYNGTFVLKEATANSYIIGPSGIRNFTDDTEKAIDNVGFRFISNLKQVTQISFVDSNNNVVFNASSGNETIHKVVRGSYNIRIGDQTALANFSVDTGSVYTIIVFEGDDGVYEAKAHQITPPNSMHILWLVPQYIVMTMGEVMFSVTGLEFSFTQAPASMKSVIQSLWLLTVAVGNLIVVLIVQGKFLNAQWKEFFLFAGLMAADMLIFSFMAFRYKYAQLTSSTEEIQMPEKNGPKDN